MRLRVENGQCMPQLTFLTNSLGFENRELFFEHVMETELLLSVEEMKACLSADVLDHDEQLVVMYSNEEVAELLRDSAVVFLWTHLPPDVRRTFVTRNVIPITRKMSLMEQAIVVLRQLKASASKRSAWLQIVDRYLALATVDAVGMTLKSFIQKGTLDELLIYAESGQVTYQSNALIPKLTATGYLIAAFAAFSDELRCRYWIDVVREAYDSDFRYLEQLLHDVQVESFFRVKSAQTLETSDVRRHVQELEATLDELKKAHHDEICELIEFIHRLSQKRSPPDPHQSSGVAQRPLVGLRIAVVGDDVRHPVYRSLLEDEGAEVILVPGFSKETHGAEQLRHADGVIFVTAYSSHTLYYALKARRNLSRTVLVNRAGMSSFKRGVGELCKRLTEAM